MALVLGWRASMNDCFVLEPSRRASATGRPAGSARPTARGAAVWNGRDSVASRTTSPVSATALPAYLSSDWMPRALALAIGLYATTGPLPGAPEYMGSR